MAKEKNTQKDKKKNVSKKEEIKTKASKNKTVKEEIIIEKDKKEEKNNKVEKINRKEKSSKILHKIDDNRKVIIACIVGFLIATLLFRCILWPDRIATLKDGTQPIATISGETITADDLYAEMKKTYTIDTFLTFADSIVLDKLYPETDELKKEIEELANQYYSYYVGENGFQSKEEFIIAFGQQYGLNLQNENDFFEYLSLNKKRELYYGDYTKKLISDKDVEKYYESDVVGDIDTKHILVRTGQEGSLSDKDAKALAESMIKKLNSGTSWEDVIKENEDKIVNEELGFQAFNAPLDEAYVKEMKSLKVGTYSKKPVKSSFGYHIVYKIEQKEKPKLDDVKDAIIDVLVAELEQKNQNLSIEAFINMRKEHNLEFTDTVFKEEYEESIKNIIKN